MKKLFKILSYLILAFLVAFAGLAAYVFKNQDLIIQQFIQEVNKVLKADISVTEIKTDFLTKFPDISIDLHETIMFDAIEGSTDTLLKAEDIYLTFDVEALLRGHVDFKKCYIENGKVNLKIDKSGRNNFTIFKSKEQQEEEKALASFEFQKIELINTWVSYIDQRTKNNHKVLAKDVYAKISYNDALNIALKGDAFIDHLEVKQTPYLSNKNVSINTELVYSSKEKVIQITPSSINIANSTFNIGGIYKMGDENFLDFNIKSPKTDVQSLLALVPEKYAAPLKRYKSNGTIYFDGHIKGAITNGKAPFVKVNFGCENASFYHPESQQKINNATFKGEFSNGDSHSNKDTYLQLNNIHAFIDKNEFTAALNIKNFNTPYLSFNFHGGLNLESLLKIYPFKKIESAKGNIDVDFQFKGSLHDLENNPTSKNIVTDGKIELEQIEVKLKDQKIGLQDLSGTLTADRNNLGVKNLEFMVGNSHFKLNGTAKNIISYLLVEDKQLIVEADFNSKFIDLDQLLAVNPMNEEEVTPQESGGNYQLEISPRLKFDLKTNVEKLSFRQLKGDNALTNLHGLVSLNNQNLRFKNLGADFAKGHVNFSGIVNTKSKNGITVQADGELSRIEMDNMLLSFENFGQTFITNKNLHGKLNAEFLIHLPFSKTFEIDLNGVSSNIHATIDDGSITDFEPMVELGNYLDEKKYAKYLKDPNLKNIKFSHLENTISIKNGKITIPDMKIESSVNDFDIRGTHTFKNEMDYYVSFPLINYKKREGDELNGVQRGENEKDFIIYLQIVGDANDFEVVVDKKKTVKSAKQKVKEEVKESVKTVFKQEDDTPDYLELDTEDTTETFDLDDF